MILARLAVAGDPPIVLDLPSAFSVVVGLGAEGRARVADACAALMAGACEGIEATVVIDGAEFEVERDLLEMLELAAPRAAVVLTADDLPRGNGGNGADGGEPAPSRSGEMDRLQQRLEELSAARAALADEETAAAAAVEQQADDRQAEVAARRDELEARRQAAADRLAAEQAATAEKADADERIHRLEAEIERQSVRLAELAAAREAAAARLQSEGSGDEATAVEAELAELVARRDRVAAQAAAAPDPVAVEAALEAFRFIRSWRPEPLAEAIQLADRLADIRARKAAHPASPVPEWLRSQTLEQLEEARAAVAAAEPQEADNRIDPGRAAALEEAHAAVDEAKDRAGRRFATPLVRRRLAAAVAAERALLDELGFPSYSAYLLGRASGRGNDSESERKLAAAKAALADAEAVWAEIEGQGDWAWPGTDTEEEALRTQARALIGPIPVQEAADNEALEQLLREYRTPAPDWHPAAVAVVKALAEAGADVDAFGSELADDDASEIDSLAEIWLAEARERTARATSITEELRRLSAERTVLERRRREHLARNQAARAEHDQLAADHGRLEAEVAALTAELTSLRSGEGDRAETDAVEADLALAAGALEMAAAERSESARSDAERELAEIEDELGALSERMAEAEAGIDAADAERRRADRTGVEAQLAALDAEATEVAAAVEALAAEAEASMPATVSGDELVSTLSARLAERPSTPEAGPLPLLVDDALEGQPLPLVERALALLLDASAGRQVVYLTDADMVVSWAAGAGSGNAVVVVRSAAG